MKKLLLVVGLGLFCIAATNAPDPFGFGSTNTPVVTTNVPVHVLPVVQEPVDTMSQYLTFLIPLVVPPLILGLKKFMPNIPTWALPLTAPIIGSLADVALQASGVHTGGVLKGALLGSAGVGLRELANQIGQAMPKPPPPPPAVVPAPPPSTTTGNTIK
jgi:hypothetical protein